MKRYQYITITDENGNETKQKVKMTVKTNGNHITLDDVKVSVKDGLAEMKSDYSKVAKLAGRVTLGYSYVYVKSAIAEVQAIFEVGNSLADKAAEMYL